MSSGCKGPLLLLIAVAAALVAMNHRLKDDRQLHLAMLQPATLGAVAAARSPAADGELRVCADPNNLPFSNERAEGFENELAELIAQELGRTVRYTWWPQRRGFVRNTLRAGRCDIVMGVPSGYELLATTRPYYRSTYVFVSRREDRLDIRSFDDPRLRELRIGVHAIGDDYANVPPAQALAMRGLAGNVRGYSIYGSYSQPSPPKQLIEGLVGSDIDVAIAWGPLAGYFAQRQAVPLEVRAVTAGALPSLPMQFSISMGVRKGDEALRALVDRAIERRRDEIRGVLLRYGVPLVDDTSTARLVDAGE